MLYYSLCSDLCAVDFVQDEDTELLQGTSDLTWANQFTHKHITPEISIAGKWLKYTLPCVFLCLVLKTGG